MMKNTIIDILKTHADSESSLSSHTTREKIASDIVTAMLPDIDLDVSAEHDIKMINQNAVPTDKII